VLSIAAGATLDVNGKFETVGSLAGAGTVRMRNGILAVGGDNSSTTFSGSMYDGGELRKQGAGTLTIEYGGDYAGLNTYSVWVVSGTLKTADDQLLGYDAIVAVSAAGTLDLAGNSQSVSGLVGGGRVVLGSGSLSVSNGSANTFSGVISGSGRFTKGGAGTLILGGSNTYTGATTIAAGTLQTGSAERLPDLSAVSVFANGTLDLKGANETIGSLSGAGAVRLGSAPSSAPTFAVGADGSSNTFSGVISGWGSLRKIGPGRLALSGANTYTGETRVEDGILAVAGTEALPNATIVRVSTGATLELRSFSETVGAVYNAGTMLLDGATLAAAQGVRIDPGGFVRGFGAISASVRNDGTVEGGSGTNELDLRAAVSGQGGFAGNIRLSGAYNPGASPGIGRFDGNLTLGAAATLVLELVGLTAGTEHDALDVAGRLTLEDGILQLALLGGYVPSAGNSFALLSWGALSGRFGDVRLPALPGGLGWDTTQLYADGTVQVVPEPRPWMMILAGLAIGGVIARRRLGGRPSP
jgi:autotransporter-associated beta strand protein